jgi:hypothetical protein
MLTRAQVAKRLGKSIATVRRLEGEQLHPRRDEAGTHRFDAGEVERLAATVRIARRRRTSNVGLRAVGGGSEHWSPRTKRDASSAPPLPAGSFEANGSARAAQPEGPQHSATQQRSLVARVGELEERWSAHERARVQQWAELRASIAEELCEMLGSLSMRELRRMDQDVIDEITDCLEALAAQVHAR